MGGRRIFVALALVAAGAVATAPARSAEKPEKPDKKPDKAETCPGHRDDRREQIVGTDKDDVLFVPEGAIGCGLDGDDLLRADRHGNTRLFGGRGDDVFCAQNNDLDRVYGGEGEDRAKADDDDTVRDVEGDTILIACTARR